MIQIKNFFRELLHRLGHFNLYDSPWGNRVMHQVFREAEFDNRRRSMNGS